jgi:hypothetical protein
MFKKFLLAVALLCGSTSVAQAAPAVVTIRVLEIGDSTRFTFNWSAVQGQTTYDVLTYSEPRNFYVEQFRVVTGTSWSVTVPRAALRDNMLIQADVRESAPTKYSAITYRKNPKAPVAFPMTITVVNDSIRITAATCSGLSAPTLGCRIAISGTVGTTPIVFPAVPDQALGQTLNLRVAVTCTSQAPIGVTIASRGFNADGVLSAPTAATGTATCPAGLPGQPGTFTVTVTPQQTP